MVLSAPPWANLQCASQGSWNTLLPASHHPLHQTKLDDDDDDEDLTRIIYASAGSVNTTPTHDYVLIDTERDGISSPSGKRFGVEVRVVMQMVADGPRREGESGLWNNRALPRVYLMPTEQQQQNINEINREAFEACLWVSLLFIQSYSTWRL